MMKVKPVRDLESQGPVLTSDGNLRCGVPGSFVTWNMNVALWVVLNVAVNVLHPPALMMLAGNALLLLLNMNAVAAVGTSNTPSWMFLILALQILIVLQYGGIVLNGIF